MCINKDTILDDGRSWDLKSGSSSSKSHVSSLLNDDDDDNESSEENAQNVEVN